MLNWGKYALLIILFVCSGLIVNAQTNPAPFNLGGGNYFMGAWASASPAFSYPPNMFFHTCARDSNPLLGDPTTANYTGAYNLGSGNRFAGLGLSGYSHFNYSKTPNTIGASVLGLNSDIDPNKNLMVLRILRYVSVTRVNSSLPQPTSVP